MTEPFGARLAAALAARGPLCVGIDPHPGLLGQWDLGDDVGGLASFAATVVDALAGAVAVLKPQSAFFERFGSRGIAVLERTVADARAAGAIVLLDVKRGDIGSTVAAYAQAYLDASSPLAVDAVTASPYLGYRSLAPMLQAAREHGAGVFVLTRTSNAAGGTVQQARTADGRTVAQLVVDSAAADNAAVPDNAALPDNAAGSTAVRGTAPPLGPVGVVVGATLDRTELDLTNLHGPVLVPGLGAQGGTAADIARLFAGLPGVLPSTSRGVLAAGPDRAALRAAACRQRDDLLAAGLR